IALLEPRAHVAERALEGRIAHRERAAEQRVGLVPVGALELRDALLERARLAALGRRLQPAQGLERLADEALARIEHRTLERRRHVARVDRERAIERAARLGATPGAQ